MKKIIMLMVGGVAASIFGATNYVYIWPEEGGDSPSTALDWNDAANWYVTNASGKTASSVAPSGTDTTAFFWLAKGKTKYVKVPSDLAINRIQVFPDNELANTNLSERVVLLSDGTLTLGGTSTASYLQHLQVYGDVALSGTTGHFGNFVLCGQMEGSLPLTLHTSYTHQLDLYAKKAGGERINESTTNNMANSYADITFYAPQGSDEDVTGSWNMTEGSSYLTLAGDAHVLCAGTLVHGDGIPDGAFLKRIYSPSLVEISLPATKTAESVAVTFDKLAPRVYQYIGRFSRGTWASTGRQLRIAKQREKDEFVYEIKELIGSSTKAGEFQHNFHTPSPYYPGRIILHMTHSVASPVGLGNCEIEFGVPGNGSTSGFASSKKVYMLNSAYKTYLSVTNDVCAKIPHLTGVIGTLTKGGAGTLAVQLLDDSATNTGRLEVKEGVLEITGEGTHYISTLKIYAGATVKLSEGATLCVASLEKEAGAIVEGGTIVLSTFAAFMSVDTSDVTLQAGGHITCLGSSDAVHFVAPSVSTESPCGDPALWFDVSQETTLTLEDSSGVTRISRMNDCRGADEKYMFATNMTPVGGPELIRDEDGKAQHYYVAQEGLGTKGTGTLEKQHPLIWNKRLDGIKSVFKVMAFAETSKIGANGQLLGCTWNSNNGWLREPGKGYSETLFYPTTVKAFPGIQNGEFRVNGYVRDYLKGYPYHSAPRSGMKAYDYIPMVAEFHTTEGAVDAADNNGDFTMDWSATNSSEPRAGGRVYEILVYTNELTKTEREQVRAYLMNKWVKGQVDYAFEDTPAHIATMSLAESAKPIDVMAGNILIDKLTGSGTFVKRGAGDVYVRDLASSETDVQVTGGSLKVYSYTPTAADIPSGAHLHVDASDTTSYTKGNNNYVNTWKDTRGEGYPELTKIEGQQCGAVVTTGLNGLPMMDMGRSEAAIPNSGGRGFIFPEEKNFRSVLSVRVSDNRNSCLLHGGVLAGSTKGSYVSGGRIYGLWRYGGGNYKGPLLLNGDPYNTGCIASTEAGASRGRVNGVAGALHKLYYKLDGTGDIASFVTYERFIADAIGIMKSNYTTAYWGGGLLGETILYTTALSDSNVKRAEAWLKKKWLNEATEGYRPAVAGNVMVAEGARLEVLGGTALTASALSGGGTIAGNVTLAENAAMSVTVSESGAPTLTIDGTLTGNGVVTLAGDVAALPVGTYTLLTAKSLSGTWTMTKVADKRQQYRFAQTATGLVLTVMERGTAIIIR